MIILARTPSRCLQSASAAAVREMSHLGAALAVPLLEYGAQWGGGGGAVQRGR